jgi:hypothetical protein
MAPSRQTQGRQPDNPTTPNQLASAIWLAGYKRVALPPEVVGSNRAWWHWINATITRIDREDAHAARQDFRLEVDLDNPLSVIGALKYAQEVEKNDLIKQVVWLIVEEKVHPYTAQEILDLSESQLNRVLQIIAINHPDFEIDWGSV